jgi:inner membrane protein
MSHRDPTSTAIFPPVDNLTHSLVGATFAELALPDGASREQRGAFFITGILAANLPDADLFYTRITPAPLGSLLHHRGHTHTLGGLVALALLFGVVSLVPVVRRTIGPVRGRWWALVAAGLVSHLVLDSWNSYGVHPFWPLGTRWIYGDAIFIADPWLWLLLGAAAALNTMNRRGGAVLGAMLVLIVAGAGWRGVVPSVSVLALGVGVIVLVPVLWRLPARRRAATAVVLTTLYVSAMFGVRQDARSRAVAAHGASAPGSRIVDVVLSPEPANPLCWSVLTIATDASRDALVSTRGTASTLGSAGCGRRESAVVWEQPARQSLAALRDRYARDCWTRAWLQFGRAPELLPYAIGDLRYGGADGGFTSMILRPPSERSCPEHLTPWTPPRADVLEDG